MPEAKELVPRFEELRNEAAASRNRLVETYGAADMMDPRILVARHIRASVGASYLSAVFIDESLQSSEWWRTHFHTDGGGTIPDEVAIEEGEYYWNFVTSGFVLSPFSLFEAGTRRIVRAIDQTACSGGAAEFKGVYGWLLAHLRNDGWAYPSDPVAFLDVYRSLRNTIHNNGRYYSRTGANASYVWDGTHCEFLHGEQPTFVDWDWNLRMVGELVRLNESIMLARPIANLASIP